MRQRFPGAVLLATLALAPPSAAASSRSLELAPGFSAVTLKRRPIALDDLRGKVVLLQFWASWCAGCVDEFPTLTGLYQRHGGDAFEILGVSLDTDLKAARRAVSAHRLRWPQVCDGKGTDTPVAALYDVRGTPRYVLIDARGRMIDAYARPSTLEAQIRALLAADGTDPDKETP